MALLPALQDSRPQLSVCESVVSFKNFERARDLRVTKAI